LEAFGREDQEYSHVPVHEFREQEYGKNFKEYAPLYEWSVQSISDFWAAMWEFAEIKAQSPTTRLWTTPTRCLEQNGFQAHGSTLPKTCSGLETITQRSFFAGEDKVTRKFTYAELYDEVARLAKPLKDMEIKPG